jgi:oligopeptidase A
MVEDIRLALKEAQTRLEALEQTSLEYLTWENTLEVLLHLDDVLENAWSKVNHLNAVCDSEALRKAYLEVLPEVTQFYASLPLRPKLWKIVQSYALTPEAQQLPEVRARYLQRTLEGFIDNGANLDPEKKERILEIEQRLSYLSNQFEKNVLDAKNSWTHDVSSEELRGLPESVIQNLPIIDSPSEKRRYHLTLQAPCLLPCLQYLEKRDLRQKLWEAHLAIGREAPYENFPIIREILALRDECAHILGEKTYADCLLRRRMAKNGQQVLHFIEDLHRRIETFFHKDIQTLKDFYAEQENTDDIKPWDVSFWSEKLRQKLYHFDEEALRPYFSVDSVLQGLFSVTQQLYGIRIQERPTHSSSHASFPMGSIPVWHDSVKFYEIFESSGNYIGAFYTDWFPRTSKRSGAWMESLITGQRNKDAYQYPVGVICGNLTPPSSEHPALLTHDEVITIFHEFGHLLHGLFGKIDIGSLNATHVVWDFVELPSQLMENFCWDPKSLDLFAHHHVTGESIPKALFQTMISARNHLSGMNMMRQLSLSKLDIELHQHYELYRDEHFEETLQKVLLPYRPEWNASTPSITSQFEHIFGGSYAAGYYSYLWAQVLAADAFSAFEQHGTLDQATGNRFRQCILSQGDLCDADQLFRKFMGRDPDLEALLRRENLWPLPLEQK